jgi:hypothetical protein
MTTEQKLLLALLKNQNDEQIKTLLVENIDWQSFLQLAGEHRLIPLIYREILPFSALIAPANLNIWQKKAEKSARKTLSLNSQLLKLSQIFTEHKIDFIPYKGATLAQIAYGNLALRQFTDLDFFIRKKDFAKVKQIMLENGGKFAWELSEKEAKAVEKYYYEFPFLFGKPPVLIEIHWSFMEPFFSFDYDADEVFRRTQSIAIHGKTIPTLSNEDLLIILSVHGSKHLWERLSWICDVGKLIETQPIDWELVINLAKKYGCLRMLNLGLRLAKDLMEIEIPNQFTVADQNLNELLETVKAKIFGEGNNDVAHYPQIHLKMRERWRDKFSYSHRLFTTKLVDSLFMPMGRPR